MRLMGWVREACMSNEAKKSCPVCGGACDVRSLAKGVVRLTCPVCGWSEVVDTRGRRLLTEPAPFDGGQ